MEGSINITTIETEVLSNESEIVCFEDLLYEATKRFDIEKNIKNELYAFLAHRGLMDEYMKFSANYRNGLYDGPHEDEDK